MLLAGRFPHCDVQTKIGVQLFVSFWFIFDYGINTDQCEIFTA